MKQFISLMILAILVLSCSNKSNKTESQLIAINTSPELSELIKPEAAKGQIATFLTFQENNAEEAMNFYISLFENSKVTHIQRHGAEGPGKEGSVFYATFELNGSQFACSDSPIKHAWNFTPGVSVYVECQSDTEIESLFKSLSENGMVMMPLNNYGWSTKFGFVQDRFGVSWQLNLN